jgi:Holliday junction resolvasome RuvABC ATP-dependent DNA helicase subunit
MNICKLFSRNRESKTEALFDNIIDYNNIKRLFIMALDSEEQVSILLSGPPASAKTMFLESLSKLKGSYFVDGASTTKSGLIDCLFLNNPKYLLIDEIDKMSTKDQAILLNLMETGIVSETKHNKTRIAHMKTSVFATSNNVSDIIIPLQSRFFVVEMPPYTYEQFYQISVHLLTQNHKVSIDIAKNISDKVWANSRNIRDCVRIRSMAKSVDDIQFLVGTFLNH